MTFQRVGEAKLDERLTRDADAFGFLIDSLQQINREVHVHALNLTPGTTSLRPVDVRGHVDTRIRQPIEFLSGDPLRLVLQGTALLRQCARGGPR